MIILTDPIEVLGLIQQRVELEYNTRPEKKG